MMVVIRETLYVTCIIQILLSGTSAIKTTMLGNVNHQSIQRVKCNMKAAAFSSHGRCLHEWSMRSASRRLQQHLGDDAVAMTTTDDDRTTLRMDVSRRMLFTAAIMSGTAAAVVMTTTTAAGASSELEKKSGEMFVPRKSMLGGGGSDETRGVPLRDRTEGGATKKQVLSRSSGQPIQALYETRFIAYLTRFLFNFDPAARSWWDNSDKQSIRFAEFAESVEVGLADYFCGPYGSYASVTAAKAGLTARIPANSPSILLKSSKGNNYSPDFMNFPDFIKETIQNSRGTSTSTKQSGGTKKKQKQRTQQDDEKQGVLNLLALLQARYKSFEAKRQLALLFSMITNPTLQPSEQIASLLGEADNASIGSIELSSVSPLTGYPGEPVRVIIDSPPALGSEYKIAQAVALLRPTSRVLHVRVLDGGEGYTTAPQVTLRPASGIRPKIECEAVATLDRAGHVDSIAVLDPGFGYYLNSGKADVIAPKVFISGPPRSSGSKSRAATAVAELEYEVYGVNVTEPGNGYIITEPPRVSIPPPTLETDWSVLSLSQDDSTTPNAKVSQMMTTLSTASGSDGIDAAVLGRIQIDPTALLPNSIRPNLKSSSSNGQLFYYIPGLPPPPPPDALLLPSPLYAAFDPIFGGVGVAPVIKGAVSLSADQYTRLAGSGAICTVIVRCVLNPLELIKTKIQLKNDEELIRYARGLSVHANKLPKLELQETLELQKNSLPGFLRKTIITQEKGSDEIGLVTTLLATSSCDLCEVVVPAKDDGTKLGTIEVAKSLVALRGPISLFQSADITFLVSLVFGGLGFGATELFRRVFTSIYFEEGATAMQAQLVLLGAAALATTITCVAATPFELIRVRSMGLTESKGWKEVISDLLAQERAKRNGSSNSNRSFSDVDTASISVALSSILKDLTKADLGVLFAPFPKIISRELPFALVKFLTFDLVATYVVEIFNGGGQFQVQVGVGPQGLAISAFAGAVAGVAGAIVSHPADLILNLSSNAPKGASTGWKDIVKSLLEKEGGISNLFVGLLPRAFFFFLVIGSQFFLYDYIKTLLSVGYDDLSLVLDVFYAVRQGLLD